MKYFYTLTLFLLAAVISCGGDKSSNQKTDTDNEIADHDVTDDNENDKEEKPVNDDDKVEPVDPVAKNSCKDNPEAITASGTFSFDTNKAGFSDSFDAVCSSYQNGFDAVYKLVLKEDSIVEIDITEGPNDDTTLFVGTTCGKAESGCNDDKAEDDFKSRVRLSLKKGEYFVHLDSISQKNDEDAKGKFTFTVDIKKDSCSPNPCGDPNKSVCTDVDGVAKCSCDAGFSEDKGSCVPASCEKVTLKEFGKVGDNGLGYDLYSRLNENIGGDKGMDALLIRFFGPQELKTYDLGEGVNKNISTSPQWVMLREDLDDEGNSERTYWPVSGSITLEEAEFTDKKYLTENSMGNIKNVKLVEVDYVNDGSYETRFKSNGKCIEIVSGKWDTYCRPSCELENGTPKMCGSDGCGGICGEKDACGGIDEQCNAEGTACEPYSCTKLNIEKIGFVDVAKPSYEGVFKPLLGDEAVDDKMVLALNSATAVGDHNLGEGDNKQLNSCSECLVIMEDFKDSPVGMKYGAFFFQQKGTLNISEIKENPDNDLKGQSRGTLKNVRLVEVNVDHSKNIVHQVQGAICLEIDNASWDTFCIPNCNTEDGSKKICGTDGCGGTCGSCSDDSWCSDDQLSCEPRTCTKLTVSEVKHERSGTSNKYTAVVSPNIDDVNLPDTLRIRFGWHGAGNVSAEMVGTFDLGSEFNKLNRGAEQSVWLTSDNPPAPFKREFLSESGTMVIEKIVAPDDPTSEDPKGSKGKIENLVLVEVKGFAGTKVERGDCYVIDSISWDSLPEEK